MYVIKTPHASQFHSSRLIIWTSYDIYFNVNYSFLYMDHESETNNYAIQFTNAIPLPKITYLYVCVCVMYDLDMLFPII